MWASIFFNHILYEKSVDDLIKKYYGHFNNPMSPSAAFPMQSREAITLKLARFSSMGGRLTEPKFQDAKPRV
jgi:hypothetical protein